MDMTVGFAAREPGVDDGCVVALGADRFAVFHVRPLHGATMVGVTCTIFDTVTGQMHARANTGVVFHADTATVVAATTCVALTDTGSFGVSVRTTTTTSTRDIDDLHLFMFDSELSCIPPMIGKQLQTYQD